MSKLRNTENYQLVIQQISAYSSFKKSLIDAGDCITAVHFGQEKSYTGSDRETGLGVWTNSSTLSTREI